MKIRYTLFHYNFNRRSHIILQIVLLLFRPNIFLHVEKSVGDYSELDWIVSYIRKQKEKTPKTIIYVQSVAACHQMYFHFHCELKNEAYVDNIQDPNKRIIEMFHSSTDEKSKSRILDEILRKGTVRVLIATVAMGMGIDIKDVTTVIVWGVPASMLQLWQQIGRAGRDGRDALSIIYAYQRSISLGCMSCKHKCTCERRKKLRLIPETNDCLRSHILSDFRLNGVNYEGSISKVACQNECITSCTCDFCKCCSKCSANCNCINNLQQHKQIIDLFYP